MTIGEPFPVPPPFVPDSVPRLEWAENIPLPVANTSELLVQETILRQLHTMHDTMQRGLQLLVDVLTPAPVVDEEPMDEDEDWDDPMVRQALEDFRAGDRQVTVWVDSNYLSGLLDPADLKRIVLQTLTAVRNKRPILSEFQPHLQSVPRDESVMSNHPSMMGPRPYAIPTDQPLSMRSTGDLVDMLHRMMALLSSMASDDDLDEADEAEYKALRRRYKSWKRARPV